MSAKLIDRIVLSTDCPVIAATALPYQVQVPFIRPAYLAEDTTPTSDVVKHAVDFYDQCGEHFDLVILLQATCPFRKAGFVDQCIEHFIESGADSFCSVMQVPHQFNPHWVFEPDENGFLKISTGDEKIIPARQMLPPAFARDGSVYIFKTDTIRNNKSVYGNKMSFLDSANQWHVNIDTMDDWAKAEMISNVLCSSN